MMESAALRWCSSAARACGVFVAALPAFLISDPLKAEGRHALAADWLTSLMEASAGEPFERPAGPAPLTLPQDHGAHPAMRSEVWSIAAHLSDAEGSPVGVTFSLSRFGLRAGEPGPDSSPWDFRALYRAHVTLVRAGGSAVLAEERFSRGAGVAGHDAAARAVWLDHWLLSYGEGPDESGLALSASVQGVPISLSFSPLKAAATTMAGEAAPLRGFAMPRLAVAGVLGAGDDATDVTGFAWLDRLWGDAPTPGGPLAYDRLIAQLDDGTDVSVIRTRRRDGRGVATVDGAVAGVEGQLQSVPAGALEMIPTAMWTSEDGGATYPVAWRVTGAGLDLAVTPLPEDQAQDFVISGWNGLVRVAGSRDGAPVGGLGTLQITGRDAP